VPDPSIPEISLDGVDEVLPFSQPENSSIPMPTHAYPWKWVVIIGGSVSALLLIALGFVLWLPKVLNTPEKTVRSFYAAMQTQDDELFKKYLDMSVPAISNNISVVQNVQGIIEGVASKTGVNLNGRWEFQDLVLERLMQQESYAQVKVSGQLHVYEASSKFGILIPYRVTHNLVRKNGSWLITTVNPFVK